MNGMITIPGCWKRLSKSNPLKAGNRHRTGIVAAAFKQLKNISSP